MRAFYDCQPARGDRVGVGFLLQVGRLGSCDFLDGQAFDDMARGDEYPVTDVEAGADALIAI